MSDNLLDRRSVVLRRRDELQRLIGDLRTGDQLPTEAQISARYGVARGTVREALKLLEQGGLLAVQRGRGRFVSAMAKLQVTRPVTEFESVTQMLRGLGYEPTNRVLSAILDIPTPEEEAALQLSPPARVVRLRRLRLHKGEALIYEISAFPANFLGDADLATQGLHGSLNEWLEARGHGPVSSAATLRAVPLPADVASLPEIDHKQTWLLISETCVDTQGVPVLLSHGYRRGNVFSFNVLRHQPL